MSKLILETIPYKNEQYFVVNIYFPENIPSYLSTNRKMISIDQDDCLQNFKNDIFNNLVVVNDEDIPIDESDIDTTKLLVYTGNSLENKKFKAIRTMNQTNIAYSIETALDFYHFIIANNVLISRGYSITDANREEKYLEIIATQDDALIQMLEDYLQSKESLDIIAQNHVNKEKARDEIDKAKTDKELKDVLDKYKIK